MLKTPPVGAGDFTGGRLAMSIKDDKRSTGSSRRQEPNGRDGLLEQVMSEVQRRIPPELARRLEQGVSQGQRVLRDNLGQARRQLESAATRSDLEQLTRRLDHLTKMVEAMVGGAAEGARSARAAQRESTRPGTPGARRPSPKRTPGSARAERPARAAGERAARPAPSSRAAATARTRTRTRRPSSTDQPKGPSAD